jgi:rubrerythrin
MSAKFNAAEILDMAAQIETKGAKFYRKAAKHNVAGRELLLQIASQEDLHYKIFADMRKALAPSEKGGYDPYGETDLYVKAMVDGFAFEINKDPAESLTGKESLQDLLKTAIQMEKDSIVFYLGLKQMVPPAFGAKKLDAVIKEELTHIAWLSNKRAELK